MPLEAVDFDPFAPADPNLEPVDFDPFAPAPPAFDEAPPDDLETVGPVDRFLDQTPVGRVLDAFGAGARDGWGETPLGLSPESEQALRENGIFPQAGDTWGRAIRTFNESMIRPAAAALDAGMRGIGAVVTGGAAAIGQTAEELGADQGMGSRLSRDTLMLAETLAITTGVTHTRVGPAKMRGKAAKIEAETPKPTEVFKPIEEAAAAPEFAGNINLSRINAAEDVKAVITETAMTKEGFLEARRGTISLAQTEEMAQALGMSVKDLAKRNIGEAFNAEELTAARNMLVQSATDVRTLAAKAAGGADTDLLAFQEAMTRHAAIQEQVAGLTAEAGRALSSFRISASAVGEAQDLSKVIETLGGRGNIEDIARKIGELDTPQQVSKFLMDARTSKTSDKLLEVWINGLLSGPQTHAVNITSNTLIALNAVPETALASAIGKVRKAVGYGTDERVLAGEAGARLFGFVQGAKEGIVAGWRTFKSEMPSGGVSKLEVRRPVAIGSSKVSILGKEFELGGRQVRIPGRMLMAEDELFKAMGYRQELNALAIRKAAGEGLTGRAKSARIAELTANPTKDMMEKAVANAEYQTFTNNLGKMGAAVQRFSQSHPAVKLVIPFVRTPVNILKYAGNRTPLALFSQETRKAIAAGTAEGDTYLARIVVGSSIGAAAAAMASEGMITGGGPTDPRQRALMYADGWQPYSVRIGDMYYSFGRFEPLGTLMGVAADMAEISKYTNDDDDNSMAGLITASIAKNLISKTWLSGPSSLIEAVSDPDRYGEKYVRRLVGSVVPTIAAQATRVDDPYLRDARTVIDAIKARVPGMSTDLPVRRGIWGEPIRFQGGVGPDFISPAYESYIQNDPVNQWLLGLKVWPAQVRREIKGVELTPEQYDDFTRIAGRFSKMRLDELVAVPGIKDLPKFAQVELVQKALADSRERARQLMLLRNPKIIQDAVDARKKEIAGD